MLDETKQIKKLIEMSVKIECHRKVTNAKAMN
jgi:hypothetical protein